MQGKNEIEGVFDCEITLGGPKAGIVLPLNCLPSVNPVPLGLIDHGNGHEMPNFAGFIAYVEHLLLLGLSLGTPSADWVAGRLGLSVRSLQRRLTEEDTTFEETRQRVLQQKAKEMLSRSDLSISQVAFDLGYSDPAHFSRAFQNWVGMSPRSCRRTNGYED